jgi:FKBP-type peptidyl-prolyl cis-trans isomerase FkpA
MQSPRVRLRVEGMEDRLTPATAFDLYSAAAQTAAGAAFFRAVSTDPEWMFVAANQSFVQAKLRSIFNGAQSALTSVGTGGFGGPMGGLTVQAMANQRIALQLGNMIGVAVAPPVVTPVKPTPKPTDAGMTDTMPDPNAANWVPVGAAGLKTWDVTVGTGTPVATGQSVNVFYTGWLASNGTKFDSRRSPSAPATFALSGVVQGFSQGLIGMKPGGIRRIFIPSALGYGAAGNPPAVPANADLIFEVKLISHT